MTHDQLLSISLKEDETQAPDWRHYANERRDCALSLVQHYETCYANCLVHVTRQHAVWLINELIKGLKWTHYQHSLPYGMEHCANYPTRVGGRVGD